ncbi:MAG TPA: winged helix-turn-helix domain-containing protein [Candidatus Acidoferrum sp.]|nr:winged helix-turn-helix domain-containing protein [Candidatus Acidoferrum sp.]
MPQPVRSSNVVRFDVYEVDLRSEELYKAGRKIKLQVQPFHILVMLLEQPGEVLTREELRNRLWPADTFVDFDHSLNTAIKKLRQALGDDKKKPRFVETLPKRGYRFIGTVKQPAAPRTATGATPAAPPAKASKASAWIGRVAKLRGEEGHPFTWVAADEPTARERQKLDAANDDVGLSLLIAAHKLLLLPEGTPVRVLEVEEAHGRCQGRILEGEHYSKTALVPLNLLAEAPELNAAREPRKWNLGK